LTEYVKVILSLIRVKGCWVSLSLLVELDILA